MEYWIKLVVAAVISAHALVGNSVEGVVASMLVSPLTDPLMMMANGSVEAATTTLASVMVCVAVGAAVRAWTGPGRSVTQEMRKRTTPFDWRVAGAYAVVIGALMAGAGNVVGAVVAVGLAIAVSILPPLVNAGVVLMDGDLAGARTSMALAGWNVAGVVAGAAAANALKAAASRPRL